MQNQGYGYAQQGQYTPEQIAAYQQQQYYMQQQQQQQGYPQQWGGQAWGQQGWDQQQQYQQQQYQQGYQQQQAPQQQQQPRQSGDDGSMRSSGDRGGRYVPPGARGGDGGGKDGGGKGGGAARGANQGGGNQGGNRQGGGGAAKAEMTLEEFQAQKLAKKKKMEEERQAKIALLAKEKAEREAREAAGEEEPPAAEAAAPAAPAEEAPAPAAEKPTAGKPAAAEDVPEDWDAEEEEEQAPEPAAAPAPPAKTEEPKPKEAEPAKEAPPPAAAAAEAAPPEDDEEEVQKEQVAPRDASSLPKPDPRPHLNCVFIGHVDAGKSTTCGNILFLSGCVDDRAIEKYQQEAKDKNRESWFLAYIMDTNEEEKAKGKTVEVGRAHFETPNRRFTILDAPGHKSYVPNMISGASQADIGVLIISARKGEFETGFERGGQTREHARLAKTLGVDKVIIAVNKMDDPSVEWDKKRYDEIVTKLEPFMKKSGFKDDQVIFLPVSGLNGDNIKVRKSTADWFSGPTLLDLLDTLEAPGRNSELPLRIPMLDGYKDMGSTMAIGKIEQGTVRPGQKIVVMPINQKATVASVFINDEEMAYASCGENVTLKMIGASSEHFLKGYVMSDATKPVRAVTKFKAQLHVIELSDERPVLTSGYKCVLHIHCAVEECEILKLYDSRNMNVKGAKLELKPGFCRENSLVTCSISIARSTSLDAFTSTQQLARFTLRDEGRTIAIGKVIEMPK